MPLALLPNELLTKVLEIVNDACPFTNVCLACKHLNDVAEPIMYRRFSQKNELDASGMGHSNMRRFAKAIISKPHLARYVNVFEAPTAQGSFKLPREGTNRDIKLWTINSKSLTNKQLQWMRRSLPDIVYGEGFCHAWYLKLINWRDNWDAVLAFLLVLCSSSLTSLGFRMAEWNISPYVEAVLEQAVEEQHSSSQHALLSNLKQVDLKYRERGSGCILSFGLLSFRLKSMIGISIAHLPDGIDLDSAFRYHLDQHVSTILNLTIMASRMSSESMSSILQCCNSLRYFEYQHADLDTPPGTFFVPTTIVDGLVHSTESLEELHLSRKCRKGFPYDKYPGNEYNRVESFQPFEKLRVLSVDAFVLLGQEDSPSDSFSDVAGLHQAGYSQERCQAVVEALPAALETLYIRRCKFSIFGFLAALMPEFGSKSMTKLKMIKLVFGKMVQTIVEPTVWDSWQQRAQKQGIYLTCQVVSFP